ncbi:uncharacterized protein LOC122308152 [Carya illinoinensis]|uniref:RING-type domain-containing protein n=1 Tax=Carya illinoinensis TaxID=32201 RepID=A0A8T1QR24_CARIL|nr:uncharacterized protein LOC122308152 [Carya illinoinensis]KAG6656432.1 hypothetical protein CIPAW_04G021800 [Carya illinoinensis]
MGSESISASPAPVVLPKELSKKKRTNKKLKQSKLDVRREQWLSQVKNKGCKVDSTGRGESHPSAMRTANVQSGSLNNLGIRSRKEDNEGSGIHRSDLESLLNSPIGSSLDHNDSRKSLGHSSSNSSTSSRCYSGSTSEVEEDDGCLDDWEAVADALNVNDNQHEPIPDSIDNPGTRIQSENTGVFSSNHETKLLKEEGRKAVSETGGNCRAWRPDDAFRPQGLPTLSKQHTFPMNSEWHRGSGAIALAWQSIKPEPSSCPICYEDLDITDSSFLPCSCGFRLCLFCHKRILEADGRCPGCRKQYDHINADMCFSEGVPPFQVPRSRSLSTRP